MNKNTLITIFIVSGGDRGQTHTIKLTKILRLHLVMNKPLSKKVIKVPRE